MREGIHYVKRQEVNATKWDRCIDQASNGLIYAYSFYLDTMTDSWDALVLNDYEALMPLPWKKKYGIHYLYPPAFTAQLGLFGNAINADLLSGFFRAVPKNFRYWDFPLNHQNLFALEDYPLQEKKQFYAAFKPVL